LNAMEALSEITQRTGRSIRIADLYTCRSVRRLAGLLEGAPGASLSPADRLVPAPKQDRWPLTPVQQGMYVQSHLDPTGKTYHMAGAFRLGFVPDIPRLEGAFKALIASEPLLRTAFAPEPDGIFARVRQEADFALPVSDAATLEEAARPILAPFDLDCAPLMRAALWQEKEGSWVLLLNLHHIIGDGLTTPILLSRLDALYRGQTLPQSRLSYLDYAWKLSQAADSKQLDYWKDALSPLPEPLELPGDFPRPHTFDFRGGTASLALSPALSDACDAFCKEKGVSPYMFFLCAFGVLLSRLSGKEDLVVGAAAAGRLLPETREMCGPFINTLPLRLRPAHDMALEDYLAAVRDQVNGMLDHQQAGLEEITSALGLKRTLSQSPLYQVIFSQRPLDAAALTLDGQALEHIPLSTGTARMDLWVELARENGRYTFHLEYAKQLFLEETAQYFARCLETIAGSMLRPGVHTLEQLEALSPRDRMELIDIPNNTAYPFLNLPIPTQFQRHLMLDGDAPAVIFHGQTTSRRQLDERACQIANLLDAAGAKPGCVVGIALSRNVDLVAAVLAIWKVGGAYAPLLAHYPLQRMQNMVDTAGIGHILCDDKTAAQLPEGLTGCQLVSVNQPAGTFFPAVPLKESDLAEVLFTSGSTGNPKGVMIRWRSLANMAGGFQEILSRSNGPILCTTNVVFDMFNGEVVIPLSMGKPIVMADEEEMMLPWKLAEIITRDGVTITQSTPSRVQMWFTNESFCKAAANLEMMIYGGEVLTETLLRTAQTCSNEAIQVNMYGPTEGTVYTTAGVCDYREHVTVGRPMRNNRVYVLDEQGNPVLPGAVGELYLSGECTSAGYIGRPDLTEAAYRPDPFFPGQTMYRIGDMGRLRLDGSYDFLGRRDAQVKLNGQRVELDEINGAMVEQGCALQAATVPVKPENGAMALFTYYIPTPGHLPEEEIRARIAKVLPAYMMPSRLLAVESMPSTPTGKINLRLLREQAEAGELPQPIAPETAPNLPAAEPAPEEVPEAPAGSLDWILSLWKQTLRAKELDAERSFFEQGGTSLAALSILSHYNNCGLTLSLAQFYDAPTARQQADLLCPGQKPAAPVSQELPAPPPLSPTAPKLEPAKTAEVQTILVSPAGDGRDYPRSVPALPPRSARRSLKRVLLTGSTGFLGAHLLRALLDARAGKVLCLVRDGDRSRLMGTLSWYFGAGWTAALGNQVEVIRGDISQPSLGLSPMEYRELSSSLDGIWHCAADVRHYAADSESLLQANLGGTKEMIKLARAANAPLYHFSTTSVSGDRLVGRDDPAVFTEQDFNIGQDWRRNLYVRSKFLAEDAVFEAIRSGLNARIFRVGRLVGRAGDGTFQKNADTNAFWLTLRGVHAVGAIPRNMAAAPMELTPVDWCAQAAVALRSSPMTVFHLQAPDAPTVEDACRAVVPDLEVLSEEDFAALMARMPVDARGNILAPLIDLWHRLDQAPPTIAVDSALTEKQLDRVGFTDPIPTPDRLLRAFRFDDNERIRKGGR